MKKTLLLMTVLVSSIAAFGQNLIQNGGADDFTGTTSDNADAFDMTPSSTVKDNDGVEITSPYKYDETDNPNGWNNSDLEDYLETLVTFAVVGDAGIETEDDIKGLDEQPGSSGDGTYDGATKTRGLKLYDDADDNPAITESSRRLYQKVKVTPGTAYTFSIDSRSEASGTPSDVFILNEEITTEVGLENGAEDARVDAYLQITNDENSSKGGEGNNTFTTNTLGFVASGDFVVIYIRALGARSKSLEVFYDNLSLMVDATASTDSVFASSLSVYPNPASGAVTIKSGEVALTSVQLFNTLGRQVYASKETSALNVSSLAKGIYFLKLNGVGVSTTKKIIVE